MLSNLQIVYIFLQYTVLTFQDVNVEKQANNKRI